MTGARESSSDRVLRLLREAGSATEAVRLEASARTAELAAAAIGCTVAQIVKSLIFKGAEADAHFLVLASGVNRADEARVAAALGQSVAMADAKLVRERTGYAIGGVSPIGHVLPPAAVLIDRDLATLDPLWAAAGHPHMVFRTSDPELARLTGGRTLEIG